MTEAELTPRDRAQKLIDKAYAKVLGAIRDIEAVEKIACEAQDNAGIIAAGEAIIALRRVKIIGLQNNGQMGGVVILGGGT